MFFGLSHLATLESGGGPGSVRLSKAAQTALQNLVIAKAGCEIHTGLKSNQEELASALRRAHDRHTSLFIDDLNHFKVLSFDTRDHNTSLSYSNGLFFVTYL